MKHWGMILKLAIPSIFSFATATLTGTINLIMVGQMGFLAIAIVGVCNIVMYNAWALFSGLGHTVNYLVAQSYGAGNTRKAVERTYAALCAAALLGLAAAAVGIWFSHDILRLLGGAESAGIAAGEGYLQFRFAALAFGIVSFVFHGFFRGIGDTVTPMVLSIVGNGLMIFFTYGLTYGKLGFPELGLNGAGAAVLIGEAVALLGAVYMYFIHIHPRMQTRVKPSFRASEIKLIFAESGKLGVQEFSLSLSMLIFTKFVLFLGEEAAAANEIALNVMSLGFMPAFAFGSTATILVGQAIGRANPLDAKRYGTDVAIIGSIFLLAIGTIEFFLAEPIARIFNDDPDVYQLAGFLIMISAFLQVFDGLLNFFAGALRGIGDTSFLLTSSFGLSFGAFVPLAYLFIFVLDWGSVGSWLALYGYLMLFGITLAVRFYKTDWLNVKLKGTEA